jgi:hypothetical protein
MSKTVDWVKVNRLTLAANMAHEAEEKLRVAMQILGVEDCPCEPEHALRRARASVYATRLALEDEAREESRR